MKKQQEQKDEHLQEYFKSLDKIKEIVGRTKDGVIIDKGTHFEEIHLKEIKEEQYSKRKYKGEQWFKEHFPQHTYSYTKTKDVDEYTTINQYQLHFEKEAMIKILLCMNKFKVEFGGFLIGTIDDEKEVINIEEIFLPRQSVSGTECIFDDDDEAFIINRFQEKYLGIFHSHNTMGAFYSSQDESVISEALMLKGTKFLSVVISESATLVDRLTTIDMNQADTLLGKLLETEFIGYIFERTLDDKFTKHGINRVTVDNVNISKDELERLTNEIDRFYDEVKDMVIQKKTYPLVGTATELSDGELYDLIFQYPDLTERLFEMETSKIDLIEALIKISLNEHACSDLIDFLQNAEELRECSMEYGFGTEPNAEFEEYKREYYRY